MNSLPGNQVRSIARPESPKVGWLPWWTRPSLLLLGASLPALLLFSASDSSQTLSKAQLFYGYRDLVVGIAAIALLACGAMIGKSGLFRQIGNALSPGSGRPSRHAGIPRLGETMLSERFDRFLMGVFLVAHLIFLREFFLNPGLAMAVLGGNVELKHDFKTLPGVTIWAEV